LRPPGNLHIPRAHRTTGPPRGRGAGAGQGPTLFDIVVLRGRDLRAVRVSVWLTDVWIVLLVLPRRGFGLSGSGFR